MAIVISPATMKREAAGGNMPYRQAGSGFCSITGCNRFTTGEQCPRCGNELCPEHVTYHGQRCPDCEAEYDQLHVLMRSMPIGVLAIRVALTAMACLLLILVGQLDVFVDIGPYLSLAGGGMALTFVAALGVIVCRRRGLRRHFLAQQRPEPMPSRPPELDVDWIQESLPVRW